MAGAMLAAGLLLTWLLGVVVVLGVFSARARSTCPERRPGSWESAISSARCS
jgi:hypothetical protein